MSEIRDFCRRYGFETSVANCLDEADQIFQSNPEAMAVLEEQVAVYARDRNFDYHPVFEQLHRLETVTGVHKYTIDLLYLIRLLPLLKNHYDAEGIESWIYEGLIDNLKAFVRRCQLIYGVCGTFIGWWLISFFKLRCFTIGCLQYKLKKCKEPMTFGSLQYGPGQLYLDVHIPPWTTLTPESCRASYEAAAAFFRKHFGLTDVVISCGSWLLSPDLQNMLPEHSNILAFARDYTILQVNPSSLSDLVGFIFGLEAVPDDLHDLPEDTSLRRAYKAHLLAGNPPTTAWGMMIWP